MIVSILALAIMIACLPWWLKLHYQWLEKRKTWVVLYTVGHSLVALPLDLISHLSGIGEPSAPLAYYPLAILNAFFGPIIITITTLVSVINFWLDGGIDYCRITAGMMSITRQVVDEKDIYAFVAFLSGLVPSVMSFLEKTWAFVRLLLDIVSKHVDWTEVDIRKWFSRDYLSVKAPGLAAYLPTVVIVASLLYCAWKGWNINVDYKDMVDFAAEERVVLVDEAVLADKLGADGHQPP